MSRSTLSSQCSTNAYGSGFSGRSSMVIRRPYSSRTWRTMESTSSSSSMTPRSWLYQALRGSISIVRLLSRSELRDVVREVVEHALRLAPENAEVTVLVEGRLVGVCVGVLDLTQDRAVPVHPPEVVTVELHPQQVVRADEEQVLLRAVVIEDQREPVVVDVLEPAVHRPSQRIVPALLGLQRVHIPTADTAGTDEQLSFPTLSADLVEEQLPRVLVEGCVATVLLLRLPVLVPCHRGVDRVEDVVLGEVATDDVAETVDLLLPVPLDRQHVCARDSRHVGTRVRDDSRRGCDRGDLDPRGEHGVSGLVHDVHIHAHAEVLQVVHCHGVRAVSSDLAQSAALIAERLAVHVLPEVVDRTNSLRLEEAQVRAQIPLRDLHGEARELDLLVLLADLVEDV